MINQRKKLRSAAGPLLASVIFYTQCANVSLAVIQASIASEHCRLENIVQTLLFRFWSEKEENGMGEICMQNVAADGGG